MKVRWREYESILVLIVTVSVIISECWKAFAISAADLQQLSAPFVQRNIPFHYYHNVLLPKIGIVMLLSAGYFWLSKIIIPGFTKSFWRAGSNPIRIVVLASQWLILVVALTLAAHIATSFVHPHFWSYGGWRILAFFGYSEIPFQDFSKTISRALGLVFFSSIYLLFREGLIHIIETTTNNRTYKAILLNQIALILLLYFSIAAISIALNLSFERLILLTYFTFVPSSILVFFFNLYWLFPNGDKHSFLQYKTLLKILLITFIGTVPTFLLSPTVFGEYSRINSFLACLTLQITVVTPISLLYYLQRKDKINALFQSEKKLRKSTADLQFLRSQINPHFLFNALNTLYGTAMRENAPDTVQGIQRLGEMMRFMLHENHQDFIPLQKEIEYLQHYIALQRLRLTDNVRVEVALDDAGCSKKQISPMLLIPFVENAFKHGVSAASTSLIKIQLECKEDHIEFIVQNSIPTISKNDPEKNSNGIGLDNVRQRLQLFYPNKHVLSAGVSEKGYLVNLSIKLI
jgi:sensor histidine kinase YesM